MSDKAGSAGTHRWKEANRPPPDEAWVWLTQGMLESPAWGAMTASAKRIVERVAVEHMGNKGRCNGELIVTYADFARFGIRKSSVIEAIAIAVGLGWIDVTVRGSKAHGTYKNPSQYALTWLPRRDGTPAVNRWKGVDEERARKVVAGARDPSWRPKRPKRDKLDDPLPGGDIESSHPSETGNTPHNSVGASRENETGKVPKLRLVNERK
jgi:hypothetical protein